MSERDITSKHEDTVSDADTCEDSEEYGDGEKQCLSREPCRKATTSDAASEPGRRYLLALNHDEAEQFIRIGERLKKQLQHMEKEGK